MTAVTTPRHRVSAATAQMRDLADSVLEASVWSMDAAGTAETLTSLTRLRAQVEELCARVAAHADSMQVGREVGAASAANWLAHQTRTTRAEANRAVRLGHDLEQHPQTRVALGAGDIVVEQARVILRWVDQLTDSVDPGLLEKAERHLLEQAHDHDAKGLNALGKHLYEVIAPEQADAHEAALLEREEAAAAKACRFTMVDDGQGKIHGRFTLPTFHGAALKKILLAMAAPKHLAATQGPGTGRPPTPEALGRAFCELIERYPVDRLPKSGGVNATVVVLIDEASLLGRPEKAGVLDTGDRISPGLTRRLACEAGILPVVVGGDSQPLDLGRKRRLFTDHQRLAMLVRDRGCAAEGCDRTTGLHAHHTTRWIDGGRTNLADAISLCSWHHSRAHDTRYQTTYQPTGAVTFHRRT